MTPPAVPAQVRPLMPPESLQEESEPLPPLFVAGRTPLHEPSHDHDPARIRGLALRHSLRYTTIAWMFGAFWMAAIGGGTATELAKHLGANDFVFALLAAGPLASVLLQIPGALMVERLGARKRFFIWTVTPHRTLYMVVGLLPWILPAHLAWPALVMALLLVISTGLNHFGGQAWVNWMADLVPSRVRGKYFALRGRVGIIVMALTCIGMGLLLDTARTDAFARFVAPLQRWRNLPPLIILISVVFIVAGAVGMIDILLFKKVEEPPMIRGPRESLAGKLARPLQDRQFMRYCAYYSAWFFACSFCGWFWWVYLLDFFEHAAKTGQWWQGHSFLAAYLLMAVMSQLGAFVGYPVWGAAVDRFGRKPVLFISSALHTLNWIPWIFLGPKILLWLLPSQFFSGVVGGGQDIANFNMMLQFNRKGGAGYQALGSVIFSLVGASGAFIAGTLAKSLEHFQWTVMVGTPWEHTFNRYAVLVAVGILLKFLADFAVLPYVQDVTAKPRRHAVRFVFQNLYGSVYGNLNTLVIAPLRTIPQSLPMRTLRDGFDGLREGLDELRKWGR